MRKSAIFILTVGFAGAALAHEGATGVVAERMTAMKNIGRELKAIGDMVLGQIPFDAGAIVQHAERLHENCHRTEDLFPAGSMGHHSRARPEIWQRPEDFQKQMQRLHEASEALVATATRGDRAELATSFESLQDTCSSCHDEFRLPED